MLPVFGVYYLIFFAFYFLVFIQSFLYHFILILGSSFCKCVFPIYVLFSLCTSLCFWITFASTKTKYLQLLDQFCEQSEWNRKKHLFWKGKIPNQLEQDVTYTHKHTHIHTLLQKLIELLESMCSLLPMCAFVIFWSAFSMNIIKYGSFCSFSPGDGIHSRLSNQIFIVNKHLLTSIFYYCMRSRYNVLIQLSYIRDNVEEKCACFALTIPYGSIVFNAYRFCHDFFWTTHHFICAIKCAMPNFQNESIGSH